MTEEPSRRTNGLSVGEQGRLKFKLRSKQQDPAHTMVSEPRAAQEVGDAALHLLLWRVSSTRPSPSSPSSSAEVRARVTSGFTSGPQLKTQKPTVLDSELRNQE